MSLSLIENYLNKNRKITTQSAWCCFSRTDSEVSYAYWWCEFDARVKLCYAVHRTWKSKVRIVWPLDARQILKRTRNNIFRTRYSKKIAKFSSLDSRQDNNQTLTSHSYFKWLLWLHWSELKSWIMRRMRPSILLRGRRWTSWHSLGFRLMEPSFYRTNSTRISFLCTDGKQK